jgi:hypothetical protein
VRTYLQDPVGALLLCMCLASGTVKAADCLFVPGKSLCGLSLSATRQQFTAALGAPDGELRMGSHRTGYFYGQRLILIFSNDRLVEADAWETNPNVDFWYEVSNGVGRDSMRLVFPSWSPWGITRGDFAKHNKEFPIEDADESVENRTAPSVAMTVFYDYCYRPDRECGNTNDYDTFQVNRIKLSFPASH